jgi:hypothetical protein
MEENTDGTTHIELRSATGEEPPLPRARGLMAPADGDTTAAATKLVQDATSDSPYDLLNGGDPQKTGRAAGAVATRTRSAAAAPQAARTDHERQQTEEQQPATHEASTAERRADVAEVQAGERTGAHDVEHGHSAAPSLDAPQQEWQPGEGGVYWRSAYSAAAAESELWTEDQLLDALTPEGGYTGDQWAAVQASIERAFDDADTGELDDDLEDSLLEGETTGPSQYAFKSAKVSTEHCPSKADMLASPSLRAKWIPVLREHLGQFMDDRALVASDKDVRRARLRIARWMVDFKTKFHPDGSLDKLKARWNIRGDLVKRADLQRGLVINGFAPVLKWSTFRRMVAKSTYDRGPVRESVDVTSAFSSTDSTRAEPLYVEIPEDYLPTPEGVVDRRDPAYNTDGSNTRLLRLDASAHGLCEASRDFSVVAISTLKQPGLRQTSADAALLIWRPQVPRPGALLAVGLITDDMPIICGADPEAQAMAVELHKAINARWTVTHQPRMDRCIGIQLTDNADGSTTLRSPRQI